MRREWPLVWKRGEWNPAYKKDEGMDENDYRQITLLTIVGKVYESKMSTQISSYMDSKLDHFDQHIGRTIVVKPLCWLLLKTGS